MAHPSDTDEDVANDSVSNTRRQFVVGSAGVVGGLAAGSALSGSALAQEDDEEEDDENGENGENGEDGEEMPESDFEDDVAILNYALTLEYLEARFYAEGLDNIGEEGLMECGMTGDEENPLWERAYDELQTIQEHEEEHIEALSEAIENLDGEPIEEPEFDFGLRTEYAEPFIATAVQLEDVGVSAYAGAAPYIENEDLVPPALSIHSVEARHAAFLRTLADETSFPEAFDPARSRSEVLEIASAFIVEEEEDEDEEEEEDEEADDSEEETEETEETEEETETTEDETTDTPSNETTDTPSNETTEE